MPRDATPRYHRDAFDRHGRSLQGAPTHDPAHPLFLARALHSLRATEAGARHPLNVEPAFDDLQPTEPRDALASFFSNLRASGSANLVMPHYPLGKGATCLLELENAAKADGRVLSLLHDWHRVDSLEAGSPVFEEEAAWWGASMFVRATWLYLERGTAAEHATALLKPEMPNPTSAAAHFSADLCLHWLPDLFAQARSISPEDPLLDELRALARRAPLSGIGIPWTKEGTSPIDLPTLPEALQSDRGIWRLLIDRVIAHGDREKLAIPAVAAAVEVALGSYSRELADRLLDEPLKA